MKYITTALPRSDKFLLYNYEIIIAKLLMNFFKCLCDKK